MDERETLWHRLQRWRHAPRERPARVPRPGPGQESVWDYPRPPRLEPLAAGTRVRVELLGRCLADTTSALRVLETAGAPTVYVPPADVARELLEPSSSTSLCEWKGRARYWSARIEGRVVPDVAWSYPAPFEAYAALADHFAFYPARVDVCTLDGERVSPQPGDFYGGWVTSRILGPFKGEPGTEGW